MLVDVHWSQLTDLSDAVVCSCPATKSKTKAFLKCLSPAMVNIKCANIFPLYLVSQKLKAINSFKVAFDLQYFKINDIQIIYLFSIPLENFSACPILVISAITEKERKQRPTKIRKKVTADTNRGMLQ